MTARQHCLTAMWDYMSIITNTLQRYKGGNRYEAERQAYRNTGKPIRQRKVREQQETACHRGDRVGVFPAAFRE